MDFEDVRTFKAPGFDEFVVEDDSKESVLVKGPSLNHSSAGVVCQCWRDVETTSRTKVIQNTYNRSLFLREREIRAGTIGDTALYTRAICISRGGYTRGDQ